MNSLEIIRMGLSNLWKRKLRTFLTVLGVIIGTASIVVMVSLGLGMQETFKQQLMQMGSLNVINVHPNYGEYGMYGPVAEKGGRSGQSAVLDDKAVTAFINIKGVEAVTPLLESYAKFVSGRYIGEFSLTGIIPETMEAFGAILGEGRLLEEGDATAIVFGGYIPNMFRDSRQRTHYYGGMPGEPLVDLLNKRVEMTFDMSYGERNVYQGPSQTNKKPKVYKMDVVGQLVQNNSENDWKVFISLEQLKKIQKEYEKSGGGNGRFGSGAAQQGYNRAMVKVTDIRDVQTVQEQIREMGFQTYSLTDILDSMKEQMSNIQAVLGGIGAVSLLVAAIGITNTMFMSIYERTKEIAVMKVIGATLPVIRKLFLFEAGMIGFIGGVFGLGISYLLSYLISSAGVGFMGLPGGMGGRISIIPPWLALGSLAFITFVGLASGFYPAWRAMRISVLDALRNE